MMFFVLLVLLVAGAAVVHSCRKDSLGGKAAKERRVGIEADLVQEAALENKIITFRKKCEMLSANPNVKTSEMLGRKEALWLLEASLNYCYSFPSEAVSGCKKDSLVILVPRHPDDSASLQDVAVCLEKLTDSAEFFFDRIPVLNKKVIVTDLTMDIADNPAYFRVKMLMVTGFTKTSTVPFNNPYDATDYWFFGGNAGKCGPYIGQGYGCDAARMILQYQEWFKANYPLPSGYHQYYTDIESKDIVGNQFVNPSDLVPGDNQYDYLLFYSDPALPNYHTCLTPEEMWFYLSSMNSVIVDLVGPTTQPPNKFFVSLVLQGELGPSQIAQHKGRITYGLPHQSNSPGVPTVLDPQ